MDNLLLSSERGINNCDCKATILIVDDNMFNLVPLELMLDELNIVVDKAMDGQEAVEMFKSNFDKTCCNTKYRVILMDINMPIMDGYTATTHII